MDIYTLTKVLHILSATVLFGTGLGTAFFMFRSGQTSDITTKYFIARTTVIADYLFTAPAVIVQPLTGAVLVVTAGHDAHDFWLVLTYGLYGVAGLCWLPVVWIQIQLRDMLKVSVDSGTPLPERYSRLFRLWFALGWPAFISLITIFYLMVSKHSW